MTVKLTNNTRRMKVFHLPHDTYCAALKSCACVALGGRDLRRIPSSLTIPSGGVVVNLPDAVLAVPEIVAAVKKRDLLAHQEEVRKKKTQTRKKRRTKKKKDSKVATTD